VLASERVPLARTKLEVSRLGFGSGPIGGLYEAVSDDEAGNAVRRALDHKVRLLDTAPLYGLGMSERRLGVALRDVPRSSYVLSSKVGRLLRSGAQAFDGVGSGDAPDVDESYLQGGVSMFKKAGDARPVWDFSRDGVMRSLEESLRRLQLDTIDIVYVHDPEDHMDAALYQAAPALLKLRDEGVVGAVGVAVDHVWAGVRFVRETDIDCLLIAGRCTLLDQSAIPELFPLCEEHGVAVIAASVFNGGILADPTTNPKFWYEPAPIEIITRASAMSDMCSQHGVPLRAAALQFPYRQRVVASVLVGARSGREVDQDVAAVGVDIPPELWADLDAMISRYPASTQVGR
jgi:D-threo-aldose 1-dehydrogenase